MNTTSAALEAQLEELLRQEPAELVKARKAAFEGQTAGRGSRYVLFGAGRLGQFTLAGLRRAGIEPLAFADNSSSLWGTEIGHLPVLSPEDAANRYRSSATFAITVYTSSPVWKQLSSMGIRPVSFAALAWQYPEALTPHGGVELPGKLRAQAEEVREVFSLWSDDVSRAEYMAQLIWQTTLDLSVLAPHLPQDEIYFAEELFAPVQDEVFVDCGAYNGDTVREFLQRYQGSFKRVVAIEADPANCDAFNRWLATLSPTLAGKIHLVQNAVGSKRAALAFNSTGTAASSVGNGDTTVEGAPLDELVDSFSPTFIKMDIEGAEPDALLGASGILATNPPVLAICVYHAQEHLWQIPRMIHALNGEYDLFLRRYSDECWERVCYAVPKGRRVK